MISRSIHKNSVIVVAIATLLSVGLAACGGGDEEGVAQVTADPMELRSSTDLLQGWKFVQDDSLSEADALANSGNSWSDVRLPHTWNATDAAQTAQTSPTSKDYKRGLGWYRLEFDATRTTGTQWLQFDGASIVADVWLNGEKLGQHKGAFTAFRFDVTGKLKSNKNVLLVKTDNSAPTSNSSVTAIAPLSGDFNMAGGLYRGVSLVSTQDKTHFALNEAVTSKDTSGNDVAQYVAGTGVYVRTMSIHGGAAVINVSSKLKNSSTVDGSYTIQASLLEADGKTLKTSAQKQGIFVKAGSDAQDSMDITVDAVRLWQGIADPYLYKLVVELKNSAGTTIDKVVQDIGIRQMSFDPAKGFLLNGKSVPLHGVNMHQDYLGKAWAISNADTDESLALVKEIGANTIRLAHYPHASYTYQQADRLGLVVMAEVPFVNESALAGFTSCPLGNVDPETTGFAANARLQTQELIRQQFNRASIGLWSVGNEATTKAVAACGQTQVNNNVTPLLTSLNDLAKTEDPGRATTVAAQIQRSGDAVLPDRVSVAGITDTYSVNRYFQWYYGTTEDQISSHLDDLHRQNPGQALGVAEYGAGAAISHHTDNVHGGRVCSADTTGSARICYQPEGYAGYVHEKQYAGMVGKEYIYGTYVWNMFDFGSGTRHEGDIGATNTKGLVTFDRKIKKDPFFFYKANWSSEPVTYIANRRYTERAYAVTDIKIYSNASAVTLTVNGVPIGTKVAADCPLKVCEFKGVKLAAGGNSISAVGSHAGKSITDTVTWNLAADNATNVYIAAGQLTTGLRSTDTLLGNHTFGSDNFFVGGELPAQVGRGSIGLSGNVVIGGLGSSTIPEAGRVWDMWREGAAFGYQIPVAHGTYRVTLGFLDPTATAAGARVFNVDANGVNKIANLDIFAVTGAARTAITRSFTVDVTDGLLKLDFSGVAGKAIVSNITVARQ